MPKASAPSRPSAPERRPLADDIISVGHLRTKSGKRKSRSDEDEGGENHYIDAKASKKILQIGRDLAEEDVAESRSAAEAAGTGIKTTTAFDFESRFGDGVADEEEEDFVQYGDAGWEDEGEVEEVVWFLYVLCLGEGYEFLPASIFSRI